MWVSMLSSHHQYNRLYDEEEEEEEEDTEEKTAQSTEQEEEVEEKTEESTEKVEGTETSENSTVCFNEYIFYPSISRRERIN